MSDEYDEMLMLGRAYINGANYIKYTARMNAVNKKAVDAHNKKLRQEAGPSVAEVEAEIERLQIMLDKVRA